ncbi:XdhC family protein [Rhodospirillum rubrum]|uniref:Predicted sulfurylase small subunit, molybdopterin cytosine dinucleotide biosynthesis n=1 Tax=Rhodospirillum rubrum (strain ATCC 11170 / ATH 1.1.1 / DSM 467 / LMG 4362 / NCIMB 8255 / S1) TaxID=269796 RepID=Q2RVT0_RHORT|nr:XdhC family protein [Rhodospirillum rubrum]ABC21765.1 predicted sulfurylase small subunit, molybdopterin cytosine dinucleotide biosynthesis [Rhodospirillum rubrum ATCC 11170]AEO47463.1 sulfurylase small subunit, molybdopterin cytosine dinucleotide biosynthesis [Rhodospirillum rubrum F11]MBK5953322.1 xanthine dehydrogenase [Rhodospirillum rubrum]QXG81427.1 XdhC family protein [Rhodospirillum rubrum]HAP98997.1 xanthine dehydrogenase [Rhodospirillum rubrum]
MTAMPSAISAGGFEPEGDPLREAEIWLGQGRRVALATVISTWGSSPRPVGSMLVVDSKGAFVGSVSGGCIEGAVIAEAMEVIAEGTPKILDFSVSSERAWDVGLSCGGRIQVFVEALR